MNVRLLLKCRRLCNKNQDFYILITWQIDKNKIVNDKVQEKCPGRKMKVWERGVWTNEIKCNCYRCLEELLSQLSLKPIRSWHYQLGLRDSRGFHFKQNFKNCFSVQLHISFFLADGDSHKEKLKIAVY